MHLCVVCSVLCCELCPLCSVPGAVSCVLGVVLCAVMCCELCPVCEFCSQCSVLWSYPMLLYYMQWSIWLLWLICLFALLLLAYEFDL